MARKSDICDCPSCTNEVSNKKRGLCSACASSMYYWNTKKKNKRGAVLARKRQLEFWNGRLDWLYAPTGPPLRKQT